MLVGVEGQGRSPSLWWWGGGVHAKRAGQGITYGQIKEGDLLSDRHQSKQLVRVGARTWIVLCVK